MLKPEFVSESFVESINIISATFLQEIKSRFFWNKEFWKYIKRC